MPLSHDDVLEQLASAASQHLARERSLLERLVAHVGEITQCVVQRDYQHLQQLLVSVQAIEHNRLQLGEPRRRLQQQIALTLEISPTRASLSQLVGALRGSTRERLEQERLELLALSAEAQRLNRKNFTLTKHFAHFAQQMIEALTGRPVVPRYGKTGQLLTNQSSPTFQSDF